MMFLSVLYLVSAVTFILGLKMLAHPTTARKGNLVAAAGMTIAVFGTIFLYQQDGQNLGNLPWIFGGLILGSIIGTIAAGKVKMTAMPEMVSLFNGMGGACAMLISVLEFQHLYKVANAEEAQSLAYSISPGLYLIIIVGLIIGSISFAGSMIVAHHIDCGFDLLLPRHFHNCIGCLLFSTADGFGVWRIIRVSNRRSRYAGCHFAP
jgi:H+-translocating NAD(P) transhydrogenase subunit beta